MDAIEWKRGKVLPKMYFKKNLMNNISVKNKLFLIYILCILIPVIFTYVIFLSITESNVKEQQKEQINASLTRTKIQLSKGIDDVMITAYNIMTDRKIEEALDRQYDSYREYYEVYNGLLRDALKKNNFIVKIIDKVTIYTENTTIPNSDGYANIDDSVRNSVWYKYVNAVKVNPKKFSLIIYEEDGKRCFSLLKVLNYFNDENKYNNILKIDFKESKIIEIMDSEKISGEVYMVNGENQVIYSTDERYASTPKHVFPVFDSEAAEKNDYIFKTDLNGYSDLKDYSLIMVINERFITNAFREPVKLILGMGSIFLLFAFVVIQIISYSFKYRLNLLRKHINTNRDENFQVIDCYEGRDEIGDVIKEFNRMTTKIQELITNICEVMVQKKNIEIERRQAEINALQSQINPHFLYNLLESIRMRSVLKNETETAKIIKYVSKMFRRLLQWDDDMITVREELNYIKEFLEVQKYRFGDKITYEISVADESADYKIPKMIFQPLVENACIHGIEKAKNGGSISVEVKVVDNYINCTISDDGVGIPGEKLSSVLEDIHADACCVSSIGIKNVYNRLKLIYGDKSQFNIVSAEGEGTSVFVSIPTEIRLPGLNEGGGDIVQNYDC